MYLPVNILRRFKNARRNYCIAILYIDSIKMAEVNSIASNAQTVVYYTIKSGDNLSLIASWFHVRVSDIRTWNNIKIILLLRGGDCNSMCPNISKNMKLLIL